MRNSILHILPTKGIYEHEVAHILGLWTSVKKEK